MEAKMISLRVRADVAQALERAARARRTSKSRLILESLEETLARRGVEKSSFEIDKDLFGRYGSGRRDTARRHREIYRELVRADARKQTRRSTLSKTRRMRRRDSI